MTEKEAIERSTAEGFLAIYNVEYRESYRIVNHDDAPDIRCENEQNEILNLEITLTQDRPKDIAALLCRSDHRSIEALGKSREPEGFGASYLPGSSLSGNVIAMLVSRISAKFNKDYGSRVALVIRDSSPLDWPWESVLENVRLGLGLGKNPFDKGIWLLSYKKDKLFRVI